jgi:hypothetical protein
MSAALTLPLFHKPDWFLGLAVVALGLPWSPFALLAFSGSVRAGWKPPGRAWLLGWLQIALACLLAGTLIPGLAPTARIVALGGLSVLGGSVLESAWKKDLFESPRVAFFVLFAGVVLVWMTLMIYGSYMWSLTTPFYRPLGVVTSFMVLAVAILAWWSFATKNPRRGLVTLFVMAVALKVVHWSYYVPEWNYRRSQGPWGRAIAQWVPRRWPIYTFHPWPPDLAFFTKRPVRQLRSPHYLSYQSGPESKYVLLQASEFEHWPESAPPISLVAKFLDQSNDERILARTAGTLPPPFGQDLGPMDVVGQHRH